MDTESGTWPEPSPSEIGGRVRTIRRRRGLSLEVAAGLTGISKPYLSMLENGRRRFERRGLLEDLAAALGCSVADLTGQPYLPGDRASADALATLPGISVALYDATLDDVPDMPARPLHELASWAARANEHSAHSRYGAAGRNLGALLTNLHVHAVTGTGDDRRTALAALAEACVVACGVARSLGNQDLAVTAAARGQEAARRLESPALSGFTAMTSTGALSRLGARHRAERVAGTELERLVDVADPTAPDTATAEAAGMLHLSAAQMAAKSNRAQDAAAHLAEAAVLAERTGERNTLWFSFGPANVRAWALSVAVESGEGPAEAERIEATPGYDQSLTAADRRAALHFDLARAYAQSGGVRDAAAVRHLDTADRVAPQRIRHDPVARELLAELDQRAKVRTWELRSLKNRLGVG
ncbi:helix-turn-helix domain-containing protein [Saccharothrix texasensis]|uniref:Transcriptional regulator with XRE-family HTH domain n=1 Tax=Saccharothrix texasensis TaxID=103734 RepID=A0A3N1HDY4_9PSEU|nr:helix-turn-helix domain-containing protein [Saccharothrix texasensis]ROP40715.1 transcriptional regulator with XRE-family HTH domain [Saccharothrix texasensis]